MNNIPKSFIREILKITNQQDVISFAGGLPNKNLFPVDEISEAAQKALLESGQEMLQYAPTEGYLPLRQFISARYKSRLNIDINVNQIVILNGSQQGLDLIGKVLIDENDSVLIEAPGYLGAIQAFSLYAPQFEQIELTNEGIDTSALATAIQTNSPKFLYSIPNFQNPSGISYTEDNRQEVARQIKQAGCYIVEDDPYGELRYSGTEKSSFANIIPEQTILLGSFSKIVVPGFRLGWIVVPDELYDKLIIAKQAADLHSNNFAQQVLYHYLANNNINNHIATIKNVYGQQCNAMVEAIQKHLPSNVSYTVPEGGMFLWLTLPENISALELFEKCIEAKVAFVPGDPFYVDRKHVNACRLNFTCSSPAEIDEGIKRISEVLNNVS